MLSFQQARDIAAKIVEQPGSSSRHDIIIIDDHIIETPYAWVFPYNTRGGTGRRYLLRIRRQFASFCR
ncbi:hypothetical protein C7475_101796 [Chitinophaga sp. S165]|nr:hypothetical protein C7475_101796 [Chitinophaga sp. S165]